MVLYLSKIPIVSMYVNIFPGRNFNWSSCLWLDHSNFEASICIQLNTEYQSENSLKNRTSEFTRKLQIKVIPEKYDFIVSVVYSLITIQTVTIWWCFWECADCCLHDIVWRHLELKWCLFWYTMALPQYVCIGSIITKPLYNVTVLFRCLINSIVLIHIWKTAFCICPDYLPISKLLAIVYSFYHVINLFHMYSLECLCVTAKTLGLFQPNL